MSTIPPGPAVPSTVKVANAIRVAFAHVPELQRAASGMQAVLLAPLATLAPQLERMALERIPNDPALVDELLERVAAELLKLKTDPVDEPVPSELGEATP